VNLHYGPWTVFVAPAGSDIDDVLDPDGPWVMLHPRCPDAPPETCRHRGPYSGRHYYHCDKPLGHEGEHGYDGSDAIVRWP
jgi:hypothetical protein